MPTTDLRTYLRKWRCDSFEDCVSVLEEHLNYLLEKQYPNTTPEKIKTRIVANIENGNVTSKNIDEVFDYMAKFPGNFEISSIHYLESYLVARLHAVELYAEGNQIQAFSVLAYAALNIGRANELIENAHACVMPSYDDDIRQQIALLGSNEKHKLLPSVHAYLARLITDRQPTHGWKSKSQAAASLAQD